MARFLTRDEVTLEISIPYLRMVIKSAQSRVAKGATDEVTFPNVVGDCIPVSIHPDALSDGGADRMLAKVDELEAKIRRRMERRMEKR